MKSNLMQLFAAGRGLAGQRVPKGATPNKYQPHQGKRECARRVRQQEARNG